MAKADRAVENTRGTGDSGFFGIGGGGRTTVCCNPDDIQLLLGHYNAVVGWYVQR